MTDTTISESNLGQTYRQPLELDALLQSGIADEQKLFAIVLIFLRNLLYNTLSSDKMTLAQLATYDQCETLGLSKEQVDYVLQQILETGTLLRQSNILSGMF